MWFFVEIHIGYFKLTAALKSRLSVREGAGIDTICGDHFAVTDISESGRLMPDARPIFFPRLSTAAHDHSYPKPKTRYDEEGIHIHNLLVPFPGHQLVCSPEHFNVTCKNTALAMSKCLEPDLVWSRYPFLSFSWVGFAILALINLLWSNRFCFKWWVY